MKAAAYVRVSTDEQANKGNSIEEQKERIIRECKDNSWGVPAFYIDDGYSGKDMKRPELSRLLADVQKGKYSVVITTKLDRLSRRLYDTLKMVEQFQRYDCRYKCINVDVDFSTPQGMLMLQQMGSFAEFEREMIRERVRDNMLSIARKSSETKKAFTVPCFGYDVVDGIYQINEHESKVVRMMVDWFLEGMGTREIAKRLNYSTPPIKTRNGLSWQDASIKQILSKETLYGTLVYNRTYKKNGKTYTRPQEEWIVIEDHHPAIITKEEWQQIQSILEGRQIARKQADNERWLLSGLMYCGHCGEKMKGIFTVRKKYPEPRNFRYICSGYTKKGLCFHHTIQRDEIEQLIHEELKDIATSAQPNRLQLVTSSPRDSVDDRKQIEVRLEKLNQKMQRQIEAYEDELISAEDLKRARERIDQERKQLQSELDKLLSSPDGGQSEKVADNAKRLSGKLNSENRLELKHAFRQLVSKIVIHNGGEVEVVYKGIT